MSESIFEEALRVVNTDRRKDYGDIKQSLDRTKALWANYLGIDDFKVADFIHLMILLKVSRAHFGLKRDNYVDICGYVLLMEKYYFGEENETEDTSNN